MSLSGYADSHRYPEAVLRVDGPEVGQLLRLTKPYSTTVIVGLIEENPAGKPFITQIVVRRGVLEGHYRKVRVVLRKRDCAGVLLREASLWSGSVRRHG